MKKMMGVDVMVRQRQRQEQIDVDEWIEQVDVDRFEVVRWKRKQWW